MTWQYVKHRALNRASRLWSHIISHHCEVNGGEGQLGREPGYSGGGQFFPKENLCKLLFVWILLSLSLVKVIVKVKFGLAPLVLYSMQQHVTRAWAPKHVMRVENKFREKWEVLVVVWKEIWEKIKNVMIILRAPLVIILYLSHPCPIP